MNFGNSFQRKKKGPRNISSPRNTNWKASSILDDAIEKQNEALIKKREDEAILPNYRSRSSGRSSTSSNRSSGRSSTSSRKHRSQTPSPLLVLNRMPSKGGKSRRRNKRSKKSRTNNKRKTFRKKRTHCK